ncbi:hypothetical protein D1646_02470 [Pseudoflavonifractor sp. 60]|uniref:hypothetical protein n=1 Tax=Pseudoflavonifractor sp. 60 TaxID=2304576 RepID=UPI00136D1F1C|nr:hypothetical protein [Pseudoflavonifractor sp. 60]NBI65693.1 hypothetical protein [Pseudoflavonifractor sp. 60]
MKTDETMLTAEAYNALYCKAFARLDEISRMAEAAMKELEELQLAMAEEVPFAGTEQRGGE